MLRPGSAYSTLARQPTTTGMWLAVKRPLFLAFLLGCTISLITSAGLNWRLASSATVYWSYVPGCEIAALGAAVSLRGREGLSLARTIDLFFMGHGPWTLWLIGLGAIWSFFPPARAFAITSPAWLYGALAAVIVWSAWIDFCFFRFGLGRDRGSAWRGLLLQRLISWSLVILVIGAPAIPSDLGERLRL